MYLKSFEVFRFFRLSAAQVFLKLFGFQRPRHLPALDLRRHLQGSTQHRKNPARP